MNTLEMKRMDNLGFDKIKIYFPGRTERYMFRNVEVFESEEEIVVQSDKKVIHYLKNNILYYELVD